MVYKYWVQQTVGTRRPDEQFGRLPAQLRATSVRRTGAPSLASLPPLRQKHNWVTELGTRVLIIALSEQLKAVTFPIISRSHRRCETFCCNKKVQSLKEWMQRLKR